MDNVTIGIVTYNTPILTLQHTIESIQSSIIDDFNFNIIILCNSTREPYQSEVINLARKLNVQCLDHQENRGFGAGHNQLVSNSNSTWYICCNPDIIVRNDTIEKLLKFALKHPDGVQFTPKVLNPDQTVQPLSRKHLTLATWLHRQLWRLVPAIFKPFEIKFNYDRTQPVEFVTGCFFLIKKEKFEYLKGFDEDFFLYAEDADLSYRGSKIGTNYFVSDAIVTHLWSTKWGWNLSATAYEISSLARLFFKRFSLLKNNPHKT